MTRLPLIVSLAALVTIAGVALWKADAGPLTVGSIAAMKGYSPVLKAGCMFGTHRCPVGTKWACVKHPGPMATGKSCVCRAC